MNKSILLLVLPCVIAVAMVNAAGWGMSGGYNSMYNMYNMYNMHNYNQRLAYNAQQGYYNYGNAATAHLRTSRLLNYLFGFLLLLDLTNATGNTIG